MTEHEDVKLKPLIRFPDQSPSFVHGYEAGQIDMTMQGGVEVIERGIPFHVANEEIFNSLAKHYGYDLETTALEAPYDEWIDATFTKKAERGGPSLTLLDGGLSSDKGDNHE